MKIYLDSNLSLLEYLYVTSLSKLDSEDDDSDIVDSLVLEVHKADTVIGCKPQDLFYDKTIIITNDDYDKNNLTALSKFNKVISRYSLPVGLLTDYELLPYKSISLNDFRFNGLTNNTMSKLSIDKFIIQKDDEGYHMKLPKLFLSTKIKGDMTIIGLLKNQIPS